MTARETYDIPLRVIDGKEPASTAAAAAPRARAHGDGSVLTQRKPTWLMPVSTICGRRAAGR